MRRSAVQICTRSDSFAAYIGGYRRKDNPMIRIQKIIERNNDRVRGKFTMPVKDGCGCQCLYLVGWFDEWHESVYRMQRADDGAWFLILELEKLSQRHGFLHTFQQSLEREIAQKIVPWLPCVKVVYRFDSSRKNGLEEWDNMIHLLVLVPQLIPMINEPGTMLDGELLKSLNRLSWSRFQHSESVIEIQQVTPEEMRHGICYGAMFFSFYAAPSQVWKAPVTP